MDKIYSRKRIKVPKIKVLNVKDKRKNKKVRLLIIIFISILTFCVILKTFEPIFDDLCKQKIIDIATNIINSKSSEILAKYEFTDIVTIEKNEDGTKTLVTNVALINKVSSEITEEIEKELNKINKEKIEIPLGALTGSKYLSGVGPGIKLEVVPVGNIKSDLKTEFVAQGINQTLYRVYLSINCPVKILNTYKGNEENIKSKVLLVETVIVGGVPETYYNLDGITENDTLNLIQ